MNYSTVVLGGWVAVGAVFWFVYSKKNYNGPVFDVIMAPELVVEK